MALFTGTYVNKIDKKGRVSVPASFRPALTQTFAGVVAYPSFTAHCIEGSGLDWLDRMMDKVESLPEFSQERDQLELLVFGRAKQIPFDGEGRIILPEDFIAEAGIGEQAAFVGKGRTFQIWEPEAFKVLQDEMQRLARQNRPVLPAGGGR